MTNQELYTNMVITNTLTRLQGLTYQSDLSADFTVRLFEYPKTRLNEPIYNAFLFDALRVQSIISISLVPKNTGYFYYFSINRLSEMDNPDFECMCGELLCECEDKYLQEEEIYNSSQDNEELPILSIEHFQHLLNLDLSRNFTLSELVAYITEVEIEEKIKE